MLCSVWWRWAGWGKVFSYDSKHSQFPVLFHMKMFRSYLFWKRVHMFNKLSSEWVKLIRSNVIISVWCWESLKYWSACCWSSGWITDIKLLKSLLRNPVVSGGNKWSFCDPCETHTHSTLHRLWIINASTSLLSNDVSRAGTYTLYLHIHTCDYLCCHDSPNIHFLCLIWNHPILNGMIPSVYVSV